MSVEVLAPTRLHVGTGSMEDRLWDPGWLVQPVNQFGSQGMGRKSSPGMVTTPARIVARSPDLATRPLGVKLAARTDLQLMAWVERLHR